jgi:hypothetical protein
MDELGEDARGLLEAFRAEERPSRARRDAIWNELEGERPRRKIPAMPRGSGSGATAAVPVRTTRAWVPLAALAAAAALVLVWSRWSATERSHDPSVAHPPSEAVHQLAPREHGGMAAPIRRDGEVTPERDLQEPGPPEEASPEEASPAEGADSGDTRPASSTKPRPRAEDELALVERARRALGDGRAEHALDLLERHDRAYPHGALTEERALLRAQALCAVGRLDDARALASDFVAARPDSAYAGKMRRVCVQRPAGH